jgi:hypothetical protein
MLAGLAGVNLFAAGSSIAAGFERSKVYRDASEVEAQATTPEAQRRSLVPEPV